MIAEKAADLIREKDTVKPIREYFKHLITVKHQRFTDDSEDQLPSTTAAVGTEEKTTSHGHGKKQAQQQHHHHKK